MPRDRRSTSFSASSSLLYGHIRVPPRAGPRTAVWIAMMAVRPASLLWQNTTCSWPKVSRVSKIIACSRGRGGHGRARHAGGGGKSLIRGGDPTVWRELATAAGGRHFTRAEAESPSPASRGGQCSMLGGQLPPRPPNARSDSADHARRPLGRSRTPL